MSRPKRVIIAYSKKHQVPRKELSFSFQRKVGISNIIGAYCSIALAIIIFIYTCNTNTKVEGMSDLIKKQDTAIHKQDTLISNQVSFNHKQDSIIGSLSQLIATQDSQIDLMKGQVQSLQSLVEKNQKLDSLGIQQNLKMQNVVEGVGSTASLLLKQQQVDIIRNFYSLYNEVSLLPLFDPYLWANDRAIFRESMQQSFLEEVRPIYETLDAFKSNEYLTYDTIAAKKWYSLNLLTSDIIKTIESKYSDKLNQSPEDFNLKKNQEIHRLYVEFFIQYPAFINYFSQVRQKLINP